MAKMVDPNAVSEGGGGDWTPVPIGRWPMRVEEGKHDYTKGGSAYYELTCRVLEGPGKGKKLYEKLFISDRALERIGMAAASLGHTDAFDCEDALSMQQIFVGKAFTGSVVHEPWTGNDGKERVSARLHYEGFAPLEGAAQQNHANGGPTGPGGMSMPPQRAPAQAPAYTPVEPPVEEDDLPF